MINLKRIACVATWLLATVTMNAADVQWIDVTAQYLMNPAFDNNQRDGWNWESNASTQEVRVECISFYHGNFNLSQLVKNLPKGRYRLSVQGFYRVGDQASSYAAHQNKTEKITASLYAGSASKLLVSIYSEAMDHDPGRSWTPGNQNYYPDGKEAALAAFGEGKYWNQLEFDADGDIQIGVRCSEYQVNNYCVLDNFKLEYGSTDGKLWIDMTSQLLKNPGFDNNSQDGWTWSSWAYSQVARCESMEFWNGGFDIWQEVKNAPQGKYRLSVQTYYRCGDNEWAYNDYKNKTENITAFMYAGSQEQKLISIYSESLDYYVDQCWVRDGKYFPNAMESARVFFDAGLYWNKMEFEGGGSFNIGLRCQQNQSSNWCIFDNFRLEYYGELVKVSTINLSASHTELTPGENIQVKAQVLPATALVNKVVWSSSNEQVATVSQEGLVTAVGKGTVVITATATDGSEVKGTLTLQVTAREVTKGSLIVNEIMASNVDEYISPAFNFDGWMELYNPTDRAVSLAGLLLSDPANGEGPWQMPVSAGSVPAKGFKVIWFDSNDIVPSNAPFKLDTDGGIIVISTEAGTEIVRQEYPASMERVSYARTTDGTGEWGNTATPTPGTSNAGIKTFTRQLEAPVVNQPSKLFNGSVSLSVTIPAGTTLRYTTDGTLPTAQSQRSQNGQFTVKETTCYRFRLFADDALPSPVTTRSFIERYDDFYLPVVSVVTDWDFLYSEEIGVMAKGPNGRPGNGQAEKCNWNMNWERPVNFSYLDANGEMVLNQDVNLEMCGGWSRAWNPHAFKLKGSKELGGDKNLLYPFFEQKPYIRNRTLQIRNGGNDYRCRFKDPSLQYIAQSSGINLDCQSYQPVHEFINGSYVGVLNVREPNNKHYVYANYGWDDDEIDQFEMSPDSGYVQKCGTPDTYNELVTLSADAANTETYQEIHQLLDIDEYINYMAAELYLANWDWPQNNVKAFRHRDNGRFRFVLFDLDGSFQSNPPFSNFFGKEQYTFDQLYPTSLPRITENIKVVTLFKNLLKNENFCRRFIDAYCMMGGSVYEKTRSTTIVNQLLNRVDPAMRMEWWNWGPNSATDMANEVKNNLNNRLSTAISQLKSTSSLGLSSKTAQRAVLTSDNAAAQLFINGQQVPTGKFDGQLFAPVKISTKAPAGYKFTGWYNKLKALQSTEEEIDMPSGVVYLEAHFEPLSDNEKLAQGITPVRINEVSGSNDSYIDEYGKKGDWVELYNTTDKTIDVEGMYLTDNLSKPTKYQITKGQTRANTQIPAHGYLIIWCDNKRATTDNGLHATFKIDGDGGQVALMAADQSWTDVITYGAHDANTTVVRFPDGCADVYTTNVPTIGKSNLKTSYMTEVKQTASGMGDVPLISAANGFRLRYGSQQLLVKGEDTAQAVIDIYTANGQLTEHAVVDMQRGSARLDVAHLAPGFYVARATDDQGNRVSCKFMK